MQNFKQILKNKSRTILRKINKNKYDPKIETVRSLALFNQKDQIKSWLIFNTTSKVCKFTGHASSHSIFNTLFTKFQISKGQTLNFRIMKFERNNAHIDGLYLYPLQIIATLFNCTVRLKLTLEKLQ